LSLFELVFATADALEAEGGLSYERVDQLLPDTMYLKGAVMAHVGGVATMRFFLLFLPSASLEKYSYLAIFEYASQYSFIVILV